MKTDRLLTRKEVQELTGLPRSNIYRYMEQGTFPAPVHLSRRVVRWRESDLMAWIEDLPESTGHVRKNRDTYEE